jgi:pyruvate kinase
MARRAKLVCTLGPATASSEAVRGLIDAGMDVARVNFSHVSAAESAAAVGRVREAAEAGGRVVAAMADLSGPKVRLGELAGGSIRLEPGASFLLHPDHRVGDAAGASTNHPGLAEDLEPGDRVLLADGAIELVVRSIKGRVVVTDVVKAALRGRVSNRAGVNVPAERLSLPAITEKDRMDLRAALDQGFDLVAQSFVRSADDVRELRSLMGRRTVPIVAKVENREAIGDAEAIARAADAVMIARGDLGVDLPLEEVPIAQKEVIRTCRRAAIPSIVATQMLESMVTSPRPTRAEVSDAANAVLDGADAVMLSAETAIGRFPVEAAATAMRVVGVAEERGGPFALEHPVTAATDESQAVARAAAEVLRNRLDVAAVVCFARTGRTARLIAAERPRVPVFVFAPDRAIVRALAPVWGLTPLPSEQPTNVDHLIALVDRRLVADRLVENGRTIVLVAAAPVGDHTNLLKVHRLSTAWSP